MKGKQIANYLQNYLDNILLPNIEQIVGGEVKIENLTVNIIILGTSPSKILHVFIDSIPTLNYLDKAEDFRAKKKIEKEIEDFFKYLNIPNKIKIRWNLKPTSFEPKNYDFTI